MSEKIATVEISTLDCIDIHHHDADMSEPWKRKEIIGGATLYLGLDAFAALSTEKEGRCGPIQAAA